MHAVHIGREVQLTQLQCRGHAAAGTATLLPRSLRGTNRAFPADRSFCVRSALARHAHAAPHPASSPSCLALITTMHSRPLVRATVLSLGWRRLVSALSIRHTASHDAFFVLPLDRLGSLWRFCSRPIVPWPPPV